MYGAFFLILGVAEVCGVPVANCGCRVMVMRVPVCMCAGWIRKRMRVGEGAEMGGGKKKNKRKKGVDVGEDGGGVGAVIAKVVGGDGAGVTGDGATGGAGVNGARGVGADVAAGKGAGARTWTASWVRRKKIRSRQKNLKRDKRRQHEKPHYLTEETLRGGRLQKWQMNGKGRKGAGEGGDAV